MAFVSAGCPSFGAFECRTQAECDRPGSVGGECLPDGACAYEDDLCPSGKRRSPYAPSQPGICVEAPDPSGTGGSTADAGASGEVGSDATTLADASTGVSDCQLGFAFRRELEIVADAALPAGYSLSVAIDHAGLVQAGKSAADGSDVRVFEVDDGCPGLELDRVADPRIGWNRADTRIWFAAPEPVAPEDTGPSLFLYYGHDDPLPPPADWNAVFEAGSDFDGDALPEGLQPSINPPGALAVSGGTLRLYYESLDIAAAAVVAIDEPLPEDNRFEFVNRARLVSGEATSSNMKYFEMAASAEPPGVSEQAPEHERRILSAQHLTDHQQGVGYKATDGTELSWDGAAWVMPAAFWGDTELGTYTTHRFVSSPDGFFVEASDGDTVLTTTEPVPWSSVRIPSGPRWLYMGEVFVDHYVCVAEYDWFFLRRTLDPEPSVVLGDETAL
jgi:hypothetical protein